MINRYRVSTINDMGQGSVAGIADQVKQLGKNKALIVTDKPVIESGAVEKVTTILAENNIEFVVFDGVIPNPIIKNVEEGLEIHKRENCDVIIAVGGGSSIDCAKAIGLVAENGGTIRDYEGFDLSEKPMTPLLVVTTTSGTGSEITRFSIITDEEKKVKMAIVDWNVTPVASYIDPEFMATMPAPLTASTGMDALTHAVEAYVSTGATPITDAAAIRAIEMIGKYLPIAVANGDDLDARDKMATAQFMAATAFNHASLGYVHSMAHQLGGVYDLPHGVCNAILLPHVCEFNLMAKMDKFKDVAVALGEDVEGLAPFDAAKKAVTAIKSLSEVIGIPAGLEELGVKKDDFDLLATNTMKDPCMLTNPRIATKEQVIGMFDNAF